MCVNVAGELTKKKMTMSHLVFMPKQLMRGVQDASEEKVTPKYT